MSLRSKECQELGKVPYGLTIHSSSRINTLKMLRLKRVLCIVIAAYPNKIWDCIGCLNKNVRDTRLGTVLSLRKATIITSNIEKNRVSFVQEFNAAKSG